MDKLEIEAKEIKELGNQIPQEFKDIHLMTANVIPLEHWGDVSAKLARVSFMIDSFIFRATGKDRSGK